jgi:hypothetical protein
MSENEVLTVGPCSGTAEHVSYNDEEMKKIVTQIQSVLTKDQALEKV